MHFFYRFKHLHSDVRDDVLEDFFGVLSLLDVILYRLLQKLKDYKASSIYGCCVHNVLGHTGQPLRELF